MQCRRHWFTRRCPKNPGQQADRHGHPSARRTPQPLPAWVPGRRATPSGDGRESRRCWAQPDGARNFAQAPESGLQGGSSHWGNDPEINQMEHPNLAERRFSDDIPGLLQHADLAISRAGAGSLSELAVCGTPTVLVPFPQAADRHQDENAACAASFGAAVIVHQHDPNHSVLAKTIQRLLGARLGKADGDRQLLQQMQQGMEQLAERDADQQLARLLQQLKR